MLQPNQPLGQTPQPKPQGLPMGANMPRPGGAPGMAPGAGSMPAGAAQASTLLPGGITSSINEIKDAYGNNPARLQQAQQQGDILSAIALQQIIEEQKAKKRDMELKKAQMSGQPGTIIDQKQQEAIELRRQDLEEQQAERLNVENQRSQQAMAQMARQAARPQMPGLAGLPAPNAAEPKAMASGGIVAFAAGGEPSQVEIDEILRRNPGLNIQQARAIAMGQSPEPEREVGAKPMGIGALAEQTARRMVGTDRPLREAQAREGYMQFAGFTPQELEERKARMGKMQDFYEKAYDPEKIRQEELIASLVGARGGTMGQTLASSGAAGLNYSNKMRELMRQRQQDLLKSEEDFASDIRGARKEAYKAGETAGKEVGDTTAQGLTGLASLFSTQTSAANAAAARGSKGDQAYIAVMAKANQNPEIKSLAKGMEMLNPDSDEYKMRAQKIEDIVARMMKEAGVNYTPQQIYTGPTKTEESGGLGSWFKGLLTSKPTAERPPLEQFQK